MYSSIYIKNYNLFVLKLKIDFCCPYIIKNAFMNKMQNWEWLFVF